MRYLVCGGAGYIGAHMVKDLARAGHEVVVLDNLSTGHREAVRWGRLIEVDITDRLALRRALQGEHFDGVVHMCAKSLVGESVVEPYLYYQNNVMGTLNVLEWMREAGVRRFVFSSTAAVFGHPQQDTIDETHPTEPINPYGQSKLMVEQILRSAADAYGLDSVTLRYFNACGADPDGGIGESHQPETHLIPNLLNSLLEPGSRLKVFGEDYPTPDGTCIRDYVHVNDLARAHGLALELMQSGESRGAHVFNLGNGSGFSVKQVIAAAKQVTGKEVEYDIAERRAGDPAVLVASSAKARQVLGWTTEFDDMSAILQTAWHWHCSPSY